MHLFLIQLSDFILQCTWLDGSLQVQGSPAHSSGEVGPFPVRREHTRVFVWATLEDTLREGDAGGGGGGGGEGHGKRECVGIVWRLPRVREGVEGSKSEGEEVTVGREREEGRKGI